MAKLSAADRQAQIVELLSNNGTMKAVDLADYFQVSRETIRRDLIALSEAGTVKKWFGGALSVNDFSVKPVDTRFMDHQDVKRKLCEKAMEYIPEHAVLYLDTGSTVLCFAKLLQQFSGYTVITNSISAMNTLLESNNQIIMTGGMVNAQIMSTYGMQTTALLKTLRVDAAILGTAGFDRHSGPSTNHFEDAEIKKAAIDSAQTSIVLADSSKAAYSSLTQYACWRDIDHLIIDDALSPQIEAQLKETTDVITVPAEQA